MNTYELSRTTAKMSNRSQHGDEAISERINEVQL